MQFGLVGLESKELLGKINGLRSMHDVMCRSITLSTSPAQLPEHQPQHLGSNNPISLREDKMQSKGGSINPKAALKLDHLQRLALWTGGETSIPSLGAFFGHKLASTQEGLDVPADLSMVSCQRYVVLWNI